MKKKTIIFSKGIPVSEDDCVHVEQRDQAEHERVPGVQQRPGGGAPHLPLGLGGGRGPQLVHRRQPDQQLQGGGVPGHGVCRE